MKKLFSKITAVLLALLVLLSTFSFTVEKHYCGDFLVDVSFTGEAEGCGMEMTSAKTLKKNCCKDEVSQIEGQDELTKDSLKEITFNQQQFILAFVAVFSQTDVLSKKERSLFKEFSPPDLLTDYQATYQVYII